MKAMEARGLVRSASHIYVSVSIRSDDVAVLEISKAQARKLVNGWDPNTEINVKVMLNGTTILIGE